MFVYELELCPNEAALLMHAGIASISALANSSPQSVLLATGRLHRKLNRNLNQPLDLAKANNWIQRAKARQIMN